MENKKKKIINLGIGLITSLILVVFLLYFVDFHEVIANIKKVNVITLIILLIIYFISIILRSYRWKYIIGQQRPQHLKVVFKAFVYGYMLNQLLPAKLGEVARAEYLAQKENSGRTYFLGTIVVERVFDVAVISLFLAFSVLFSDTVLNLVKGNYLIIILFIAIILTIIILAINLSLFKKITSLLPDKLEQISNRIIDNITSAFKLFTSPKQIILLFFMTLFIWCITCFIFYLIINDLNITLPYYAYFFIVSAGTFGMVIPSTSGNIGVYHAVAVGALMLFMVPKENALTFAIIAHAIDFFPSIIIGLITVSIGRIKYIKSKLKSINV